MKAKSIFVLMSAILIVLAHSPAQTQIGTRFPSEKKVVTDPVTGVELTFLTSTPAGDSKLYQNQENDYCWTNQRGKRLMARQRIC
ncbi:MAG: hypothetical protein L0287_16865 [Anaerolineae bacterium]|nr:hypothetical protein [Anaerolineae bacterium]MCI0615025.1 hypothetical protein [bacterium]